MVAAIAVLADLTADFVYARLMRSQSELATGYPAGALDTLNEKDVFDLLAYVLSRADRNHKMFQKTATSVKD